eukprot:3998219-Pleurochrysis_carterae.AAC.2
MRQLFKERIKHFKKISQCIKAEKNWPFRFLSCDERRFLLLVWRDETARVTHRRRVEDARVVHAAPDRLLALAY